MIEIAVLGLAYNLSAIFGVIFNFYYGFINILDCEDWQMLYSSTCLIYSDDDDYADRYMTDNYELAEGEGYNTSLR